MQNWNTTETGELVSRQLTTRAGNGAKTSNSTYAGGLWRGNNHTWIYSGYIWNRSESDVTWTWRFTFDDNVRLMIDGAVVRDVTLGQGVVYQDHTLTPVRMRSRFVTATGGRSRSGRWTRRADV